jgi:TolA-binding protein
MIRRARLRRVASCVFSTALLLGLVSCAYYNTFYLAKKSFRAAEESVAKSETDKVPSDANGNYEVAIRQSKKVIVQHPHSRWTDDAIYLMGASYYGKGDYDSALVSIGLLMSRFPKTEFRPDALFLTGMCYTKQREYEKAAASFDSVMAHYPHYERRDQILFTMAETAATRREQRTAIRVYTSLTREFPKSRFAAPALRRVGELHFEAGRYDSADVAFAALLAVSKESKDRINAGVLQAQAMLRLGKAEAALTLLRDLEPPEAERSATEPVPGQQASGARATEQAPAPQAISAELGDQIARLRLGEAAALNKMGRFTEAQALLREVVQRYSQSSYAVEAQFQVGYTYETLMDSLDAARTAYDKASQLPGRSLFKDQAAQRSKALQAQIELEKKAGAGDTEAEERAASALRVAEILLLDRDLVDDAIARYQAIEKEYPESRSAPRAAYALAYIRWKKQGDSLEAQQQFRDLVKSYPSSPQARGAISILAAQRADTSGLAGLLRAVVPEPVPVADTLAARGDSVTSPVDTTLVRERTPEEGAPPLDLRRGTIEAPGDSSRVREDDKLGPPRRGRRHSSHRPEAPDGSQPPPPASSGRSDGQLPPAPPPAQPPGNPQKTPSAQPQAGPSQPPASSGRSDGQLPPAPPPAQPSWNPQKAPSAQPQAGPSQPPSSDRSDGQLPPAPPPAQPPRGKP